MKKKVSLFPDKQQRNGKKIRKKPDLTTFVPLRKLKDTSKTMYLSKKYDTCVFVSFKKCNVT